MTRRTPPGPVTPSRTRLAPPPAPAPVPPAPAAPLRMPEGRSPATHATPALDARVPSLSVVMPAYDEEAALPGVLAEALPALREAVDDWELIVVDDGSRDRTARIVREVARREPRVRLVRQPINLGYSQALLRGLGEARKAAALYTDADGQFDLRELTRLYPLLDPGRVDLVVGYRAKRRDPAVRLLTSRVYNWLQRRLLGTRVRDVNCAFKLFSREYLDGLEIRAGGYLVDAEFLARARARGMRWEEVPVTHRPRLAGSTKVQVSTITETLRELWRLRRTLRDERRAAEGAPDPGRPA